MEGDGIWEKRVRERERERDPVSGSERDLRRWVDEGGEWREPVVRIWARSWRDC